MKDKLKTIMIVLFIVNTSFLVLMTFSENISEEAKGATISVPGDYLTISSAVENASEGDNILVGPGEYEEEVIVEKPLTIQSTDGPKSTIVSNVGYTTFRLDSNNVTLSGFTIKNAQNGIFIEKFDSCTITNNIITRNYKGILIYGNYDSLSTSHTISNNKITDNDQSGIYLGGHACYNTVSNNLMAKNDAAGITVYQHSEYNIIKNNTVRNNVDNGIYLVGSGYSTVRHNEIYDNEIYGIHSLHSYNNKLRNNTMYDNKYNFRITGELPKSFDYTHDIDTSNLIEGKSMYYFVEESDKDVPSDAGFVGLVDCENILVSDVNVSKTGSGILLVRTNNSIIKNSVVRDNLHGILALYSNYNTIENIYGTRNDDTAVRIEYSRENKIFLNNLSENSYRYGDGLELYNCNNHTIGNNTVNENGGSGINIMVSEHCNVLSNIANYNHNGYGVYVGSNSDYNDVNDNILIGNDKSNIALSASQYNHIINNNLDSSQDGSGVRLDYSSFNLIDNNKIIDNDFVGVYISNSDLNTVTNNSIETNYAQGVHIRNSDENIIRSNYISDNQKGIRIESMSEYNKIVNNTILNSQLYGIYLSRVINNDIYKNTVYKTEEYYGIYLKECNDNKIYWNDFIDNGMDCFDDSNNTWSLPYPDGGNYWSNYSGIDDMSGPNQDQPGSDGFGDTPYTIPGGDNEDKYPLMEPLEGIGNTKPKASFTVDPYTGDLSTVFIFDSSSSSDNEDSIFDLLRRWDWEDDGFFDTSWLNNFTVAKSFDDYGIYDVRLQVKDTGGLTDSVVKQVYVYSTPSAPKNFRCMPGDGLVKLSWDEPEDDGGKGIKSYAIYKGTQSSSLNFYKQVDEKTFSYTDTQVSNGVTYHYMISAVSDPGEGNKTQVLSATPEEGLSPYIPPEASFTHNIIYPIEDYGYRINLVDNSTKGEGEIVNYSWKISKDVDIFRYGKSVEISLEFGAYSVELTVLDDNGQSDTEVREIDLSKPEPPRADFTWSPYYAEEYDMVWMVDKSIPGDNPITNWTYEFNDGEFYLYSGGWFGPTAGVYSVNLTVSDGYLTDSIMKEIMVPQSISYNVTPGEASLIEDYEGNVSIGIEVETSTELNLFEFPKDPANGTLSTGNQNVGKCYGIELNNSGPVKWPIVFRMYYTDEQLNESAVTEDSLKIFYWDEDEQEWHLADEDYILNTTDQNGYSGYVECNLDHLTIFTLAGKIESANLPPMAICGDDITVKVNEIVTFDASKSTDDTEITNYTWVFDYDGKTHHLYGEVVEFKFKEKGTYQIDLIVKDTNDNTDSDTMIVKIKEDKEQGIDYILYSIIIIFIIIVATTILVIQMRRKTRR